MDQCQILLTFIIVLEMIDDIYIILLILVLLIMISNKSFI